MVSPFSRQGGMQIERRQLATELEFCCGDVYPLGIREKLNAKEFVSL